MNSTLMPRRANRALALTASALLVFGASCTDDPASVEPTTIEPTSSTEPVEPTSIAAPTPPRTDSGYQGTTRSQTAVPGVRW